MKCEDKKCFVHGDVKVRGFSVDGVVVSDKGKHTVIVERALTQYVPKYERYARRNSSIPAHNPECIGAKVGDTVRISECRKLSRTKAWTVVQILQKAEAAKVKK
ncbi:MAG: 30S ribosomal protein S17 [Candidatus Micrarchaeota archaeon]|nr:30S ribosomal protein S17 [Candidatus Micrarchaeota archaeon]